MYRQLCRAVARYPIRQFDYSCSVRYRLGLAFLAASGLASPGLATTFRQSLDVVAQSHPRLAAADAAARAGRFDVGAAKAPRRLQLALTGDAGIRTNDGSDSLFRPGVSASQLLYDGGRIGANVRRVTARADALDVERAATLEDIAARLAAVWLDWTRERALGAIADEQVVALGKLSSIVRDIASFDRGRESDVSLVATRLAQSVSARDARVISASDARAQIRQIAVAPIEPEGELPSIDSLLPPSLDAALVLLAQKPDIRIANLQRVEAEAVVQGAKAYRRPRLSLQGSALTDDARFGRGSDYGTIELSLRSDLSALDGGAGASQLGSARASAAAADRQALFVREDAEAEVRRQWALIGERKQRLSSLEALVTSTDKSRDTVFEQFRIGRRSVLDLLSFEVDRFNARAGLEGERRDLLAAQYRLLAALGVTAATLMTDTVH